MNSLALVAMMAQLAAAADVERAVMGGIRDGVFPGAVVVIGTRDSILFGRGYGHFTWSAKSQVPNPDSTLYDLASLTKVIATTPSIMLLAEAGLVSLEQPVRHYLPGFVGPGKEEVQVRNLLAHNSGLRAFLRLDTLARDPAGARRIVLQEPLRWTPGARVEYSDLNAMLLGWIVERVSGLSLDSFARTNVFEPLGMTQTMFLPPRSAHRRAAPVNLWRGTPIAGAVNDQNAARLGGVAGHAGLFSTGRDVARYAQVILRRGERQGGSPMFRPATVDAFTQRAARNRALGWESRDTASTDNSGKLMSSATFGHTGFTGTSLWIDPVHGVFAVLLTNRVFAPRSRRSFTRIKQIRGQVADAAVSLAGQACRPLLAASPTQPAAGC